MPKFKRISIGELNENNWLVDALEDYIKKNPMVSDIKVINHFKLRVDLIENALTEMRLAYRLERYIVDTITYYRILKITDEDLRRISLPTPFGNL